MGCAMPTLIENAMCLNEKPVHSPRRTSAVGENCQRKKAKQRSQTKQHADNTKHKPKPEHQSAPPPPANSVDFVDRLIDGTVWLVKEAAICLGGIIVMLTVLALMAVGLIVAISLAIHHWDDRPGTVIVLSFVARSTGKSTVGNLAD